MIEIVFISWQQKYRALLLDKFESHRLKKCKCCTILKKRMSFKGHVTYRSSVTKAESRALGVLYVVTLLRQVADQCYCFTYTVCTVHIYGAGFQKQRIICWNSVYSMFAQSSSHREIIYKRSKIIFHNRNVIVFDQNIMFWLPTGSYLAGFYFKIETQIRSWPHYFKLKRASDLDPHSLSWGPGSRSWNRISLSADPDQGKQKIVPKEKCVSYLSGSRRTSIMRIHEEWGSGLTSLLRTYFLHVTRQYRLTYCTSRWLNHYTVYVYN